MQILDFVGAKTVTVMKKRSSPGRKKTHFLRLDYTAAGRESFRNLSADDLVRLLSVSRQTAYKWIQAGRVLDADKLRLLRFLVGGDIPWPEWERWRLCPSTNLLLAPNGYTFAPGELMYLSLQKQLLRETQAENARLLVRVRELENDLAIWKQKARPGGLTRAR